MMILRCARKAVSVFGRLGEEVSDVVRGAHIRHTDLELLNHVAHEIMPAGHTLHAVVIDRVVSCVARTLVVREELGRAVHVGERGLGYRDGDAPQGPASDAEPDVAEAASPADDAAPSAARASGSALPQGFFVTLTTRSSTRMAACMLVFVFISVSLVWYLIISPYISYSCTISYNTAGVPQSIATGQLRRRNRLPLQDSLRRRNGPVMHL